MAEQTFKSPGFFEREIEIISRPLFRNYTTPVGVIGSTQKGPAFVPTTVTSFQEYVRVFGQPEQDRDSAHAAAEFFSNGGKSLTMCRVLGAGHGSSSVNAGFKVVGTAGPGGAGLNTNRASGAVQFIVADHTVNNAEHVTLGLLNDNNSITLAADQDPSDGVLTTGTELNAQLIRAMIFMEKDHSMLICEVGAAVSNAGDNDVATASSSRFKLIIVNKADEDAEVASYVVSLDPSDDAYISKVLNTDSFKHQEKLHYLYADFPVDTSVADVAGNKVAILRGKDSYLNYYGDFSSKFTAAQTPMFISQPYGEREYELFKFESIDDGEFGSGKYKVSISDLRASTDPNDKFGTFSVQVRDLYDSDLNPTVFESFERVSLNPNSDNYIAKVIGDQKIYLNLATDDENEKRLVREGTYENQSERVRIKISDDVLMGEVPEDALPFGFRGIPTLKTTSTLKDGQSSRDASSNYLIGIDDSSNTLVAANAGSNKLLLSVIPPLPYRMKVTLGDMRKPDGKYFQTYLGQVLGSDGLELNSESVNTNLHWGLNASRITDIHNPNRATDIDSNRLAGNLVKTLGKVVNVLTSGLDSDTINNNKFSLAKVALKESSSSTVSGTVSDVYLEAVYIRNAEVSSNIYDSASGQIKMSLTQDPFTTEGATNSNEIRLTLAGLLKEDKVKFNKYNRMAKFTAPMYGGFDGVNIMDKDSYYFTDKSASVESGGHGVNYTSGLSGTSSGMSGERLSNNSINAFRSAVKLMTDELVINHNVLVLPGIRDDLITSYVSERVKEYGKAIYLMDIPHYDSYDTRIFLDSSGVTSLVPDADATSTKFNGKDLDNNYVATYFPDVTILDQGDDLGASQFNPRLVHVPASVVALGALAKTDNDSQPWYAPAGFSRGALASVASVDSRLNAADRDTLYESRINPIASFPNNQFVIFGQKTTQVARTALDRVNVRRLMIEIKMRIEKIALGLLFAQNDAQTRSSFISSATRELNDIQINSGIEDFRVIMDETNNTDEDVDNNRLNGKIIVVPTRAVEFIAMDFIITNSGVEFPS